MADSGTVVNNDRYIDQISGKIGQKPIYQRNIADSCKKNPKFPLTDYRREISCRHLPTHEILADISDISITGPYPMFGVKAMFSQNPFLHSFSILEFKSIYFILYATLI